MQGFQKNKTIQWVQQSLMAWFHQRKMAGEQSLGKGPSRKK
jgi:hypothetical protein